MTDGSKSPDVPGWDEDDIPEVPGPEDPTPADVARGEADVPPDGYNPRLQSQ